VTYEGLIKAAEREHAAEQNRDKAAEAWRRAWWKTTLELGQIPSGDAGPLRETAGILGQTYGQMRSRRMCGRAVQAGLQSIYSVPPEFAMEYTTRGSDRRQINSDAAEWLIAAERGGMSRREFAAEIGTSREGVNTAEQRRMAPATPQQVTSAIHEAHPDVKASIARQVLSDPDVVRKVMADPQTREVVNRVENERVADRFARSPIERTDSTQRADDLAADSEWVAEVSKAGGVLATAQALMADAPKSDAARRRGLAALRDLLNRAEAMRDVLALDMDAELERMTRDQ
jgi:hypothetical protein